MQAPASGRTGRSRVAVGSPGTGVYLLAHFAKSQLWHARTLLFGFFLTEACGLDARTMAVVMATSLIVNAAVTTWAGDRPRTNAGDLRRQRLAAPLTCLCFLLCCATPLLDPVLRAPWAMVTLLAFRVSYPSVTCRRTRR